MDKGILSSLDSNKVELWEKLQKFDLSWGKEHEHYYTDEMRPNGIKFAKIIREQLYGKCLDVGCGILPLPYYMKDQPNIEFAGIDPDDEGVEREFEFKQALGEELPFKDKTFDGVIFTLSLDHTVDPELCLTEAHRVLVNNGKLFIWFAICIPYIGDGQPDRWHLWRFDVGYLEKITGKIGFKTKDVPFLEQGDCVLICEKQEVP